MPRRTGHKASNDNSVWRERYMASDKHGPLLRLFPHIPTARKLIARYFKDSIKHDIENRDYCFMEYQLCTLLEREDGSVLQRNMKIDMIAWVLECSPVVLHNDPGLPF